MTSNISRADAPPSFSISNNTEVQQQGLNRLLLSHQYSFHGSNSKPSSASANTNTNTQEQQQQQLSQPSKKKRSLPGTPDPTAEVIALSPKTLMATNRFVCEICNKGFQREQNLQLHRRGHNLPWKLKQRVNNEVRKKVYLCPEPSCVHHNPSRALGDLTGIKKHYSRKHGEKKWKCDKCSKKYAVHSDLKAHSKICGTREYKCDCGTIFSRRDSFITHRAFCDALAEENNKVNPAFMVNIGANLQGQTSHLISSVHMNNNNIAPLSEFNLSNERVPLSLPQELMHMHPKSLNMFSKGIASSRTSCLQLKSENDSTSHLAGFQQNGNLPDHMSATAMLHEAAQMGAAGNMSNNMNSYMDQPFGGMQLQNNSFDHAQFMGASSSGFTGNSHQQQFMQKGAQEISSQFFVDDHLGVFSRNFNNMQNDHAMLKNMESGVDNGSSNMHGNRRFHLGTKNNGNTSNGDTTTVDFLGLGGMTGGDFQQLQKQKIEFENVWSG